jgi:hypothetical protein
VKRRLVVAGVLLLASGCVSKLAYPRVKSALLDAGLSERNAACMADRMTDKLSISQLRRLESLRAPKRSLADYVLTVRRVSDPELVKVTTTSAALCVSGLAR